MYLFNSVFLFSSGKYPEVELLDHSSSVFIYNSMASTRGFLFLHILTNNLSFIFFLLKTILISVRWYLIVLICISLMNNILTYFQVFVGQIYIFFEKVSSQVFWLLFDIEFLTYFGHNPLSNILFCKYLFSFHRLPFYFCWWFPLLCKFYFDVVLLIYFCFCFPCLRNRFKIILLRPMS